QIPFHRDPWHKFKNMDPAAREEFFRKWAKARVPGPAGIYVFIFQGPEARNIQVQLGSDVRAQRVFTAADGDEARERLRIDLSAGHADAALAATAQIIRERLHANLGGSVAPHPFDWPGVAAIIVPVVGLWLTLLLMQAVRGGESPAPFAGVSTLGHGIGCNFGGLLRTTLTAPPVGQPNAVHQAQEAGYPDGAHDD